MIGAQRNEGYISNIRVIELADEQAEYCGKLLAGLGADVIKIEPPGGSPTRHIGPFYQDTPHPDRSLFFWHYNLAKRSVTLDLESAGGREKFLDLLARADVLLESMPHDYLNRLGLGQEALRQRFPHLIVARMSPFGDSGPWAAYKGSDLVHLALGGPVMNTGYDAEPDGTFDLPPIAPQMWHSYHIAGEQLAISILGALLYRRNSARGQYLSCAVHEAVAKNTELDLMCWIHRRAPFMRQTCRHSGETYTPPLIGTTKDGRWMMGFWGGSTTGKTWTALVRFFDKIGIPHDLGDERYAAIATDPSLQTNIHIASHVHEVTERIFQRYAFDRLPWKEAQEVGLLWTPVRKPHENTLDEHWKRRGTFREVEYPELGRSFTDSVSKWVSSECEWQSGPRAPLVGEHNGEVLGSISLEPPKRLLESDTPSDDKRRSRWGKPFALSKVRILDFTWWLASGGAPRFLSALGAENIKVEWKANLDLRMGVAQTPVGGREARRHATAPLPPDKSTINRSGQFNDFHAGHYGVSLNVRHPKGLEIAKRLVAISDIVAEGFSPGVMESWGLGYKVLREIKPDIIYVQQSGMGAQGSYGRLRANGPTAACFAGITEMSGLPEPAPPAGWGYSYLDWYGAYNLALAMMTALNYKARTGKGIWIDSSQVETGIFLNGTSILDWSANGRVWQRYGNRSPYKPAAPHGIYRCQGTDRWLAIACFSEDEWHALAEVAGHPEWTREPDFATAEARLANQDSLDRRITEWTLTQDVYAAMHAVQRAGVAAGVCQDARDRVEHDPQLDSLQWLTEVTGTEIGTWPVKEIPVKMSETPPFMGGQTDRGAPCYGEDNEKIYGELLGMSTREIKALADEGVV